MHCSERSSIVTATLQTRNAVVLRISSSPSRKRLLPATNTVATRVCPGLPEGGATLGYWVMLQKRALCLIVFDKSSLLMVIYAF